MSFLIFLPISRFVHFLVEASPRGLHELIVLLQVY